MHAISIQLTPYCLTLTIQINREYIALRNYQLHIHHNLNTHESVLLCCSSSPSVSCRGCTKEAETQVCKDHVSSHRSPHFICALTPAVTRVSFLGSRCTVMHPNAPRPWGLITPRCCQCVLETGFLLLPLTRLQVWLWTSHFFLCFNFPIYEKKLIPPMLSGLGSD